jgi:hypothetical protein
MHSLFLTVCEEKIVPLTPWPLVRKRTIPTERPPQVGKLSANFSG